MSDGDALAGLLDRLDRVAVLCVGDVMLDRFVHGTVERISPEAPVPVFRIADERQMPGGAGNVMRNVAALGCRARLVAAVGDDPAGRRIGDLLTAERGIEPDLAIIDGRPTTEKIRFVAGGQQVLRADRETALPLPETARAAMLAAVREAIADADAIILSDYAKGVLAAGVAEAVIAAARAAGRPVVVDPKGEDFSRYAGATVVTPNRRELTAATGLPAGSRDEIATAARRLLAAHALPAVLATLGADGMMVIEAGCEPRHIPASAREVFDVTGAGDTVAAALACLLAAGAPLAEAAAIANAAAGIVVGKIGTAVVHRAELRAALRHRRLSEAEDKIRHLDAVCTQVALWRRQGLRVGFTNGCFDLIHPGHVSLLGHARSLCDRLVVGLNSDASVRRLKGAGRPVQDETARAIVLASLAAVDLVVVFDDDTPMRLIAAIRPDVLVKGADYRLEDVVGADFVTGYGGRVALAPIEPGYSTSATVARLTGDDGGAGARPDRGSAQASASTEPAR